MNATKVFRALPLFVLLTAWLMAAAASESQAGVYGGKRGLAAKREAMPVRQIIVKYKASAKLSTAAAARSAAPMQRLNNTAGVALEYFRPMSGEAHVLRLPQRMTVERALEISARLASLPDVEYAEPDYIMQATGNAVADVTITPNDPLYTPNELHHNQWHFFAPGSSDLYGVRYGVDAPAAWAITTGSTDIYTAVIDTGILDHADLNGRWVGGYDFIGRVADPHDPGDWVNAGECGSGTLAENSSWHGTHVAGTIGAHTNNGIGVAGLNRVSQIVPLRVLGKCGGTTSDVVDAMRWAAGLSVSDVPTTNPYPARVINMSLGGYSLTGCPQIYQDAVNAVVAAGSVVVVSAGNNSETASDFMPANCSGVITVAATNRTGGLTYYSNFGGAVNISAPGGEQDLDHIENGVLSTLNTGTTIPVSDAYVYYQGTSMAAPHVSGIVSLMFSMNASLTPAQVTNILQATATPFPVGTGSDCTTSTCGSGIVNAPLAITMAQSVNGSPTVLSTDPAGGATGVPVTKAIKAVFSKPMRADTITAASFTLDKGVTGSVSYDAATYTATFTPKPPGLANSTAYTATITTAAADAGGTPMATAKSWSFTTGEPVILANGDFEDGTAAWTQSSIPGGFDLIFDNGLNRHGGVGYAWLGGYEGETEILYQDITIPADATAAAVRFWYDIATADTSTTTAHDILTLTVKNPTTGSVLQPLTTLSNLNDTNGVWAQSSQYDLLAYKGQTIRLTFTGTTNSDGLNTNFFLDDVEFPVTLPPKNLTVTISGNGSVNSNPSGIACTPGNSGICTHQFPLASMVTLMPSAAADSMIGSWTGCTSFDGDNCLVQMTAVKNVTSNFISLPPVHVVGGSYYDSFLLAYIPAPASCTIQAKAVEVAGDFTPNNGKTVWLRGGYDSTFSSNSGGYTVINGKLTIQSGSLTIENLVIR